MVNFYHVSFFIMIQKEYTDEDKHNHCKEAVNIVNRCSRKLLFPLYTNNSWTTNLEGKYVTLGWNDMSIGKYHQHLFGKTHRKRNLHGKKCIMLEA